MQHFLTVFAPFGGEKIAGGDSSICKAMMHLRGGGEAYANSYVFSQHFLFLLYTFELNFNEYKHHLLYKVV